MIACSSDSEQEDGSEVGSVSSASSSSISNLSGDIAIDGSSTVYPDYGSSS